MIISKKQTILLNILNVQNAIIIVFLSMIKVVLIGTGKVAKHLFKAFYISKQIELVQVIGRSKTSLLPFKELVDTSTNYENIKDADIYIIAISDTAINPVSEHLKTNKKFVVHTSGSTPMKSISSAHRKGVFYPLQTFSSGREIDLSEVPFCLETEYKEDYRLLQKLAHAVSEKVYSINSEQRKLLHLAAVYVNNFTNHMYFQGNKYCEKAGVPFSILTPLIIETAKKIEELSPYEAQTGPGRRNDKDTSKSLEGLIGDPIQKDIFALVTKSIENTYDQEL